MSACVCVHLSRAQHARVKSVVRRASELAKILKDAESVRSRYLRRTCPKILPAFLHADSTHLQVQRVVTRALVTFLT